VYLFAPKSAPPAFTMAETFGRGAPMILGATPAAPNVLAGFIL
jgi:hypothetical protein